MSVIAYTCIKLLHIPTSERGLQTIFKMGDVDTGLLVIIGGVVSK